MKPRCACPPRRTLMLFPALVVTALLAGHAVADVSAFWQMTFPDGVPAIAKAVAVDTAGNTYVGGAKWPAGVTGSAVAVLTKFSSNGVPEWTYSASGDSTAYPKLQEIRGVAIMKTSATTWDIIVAGVLTTVTGAEDMWAARVTTAGREVWTWTYDSGVGSDGANAVAVTPSGVAYVAGWAGNQNWVSRLNGITGAYIDSASFSIDTITASLAVTLDSVGNVYVGGQTSQSPGVAKPWVGVYPPGLVAPTWSHVLTNDWTATAFIGGVAVDSTGGAVYAVGGVTSAGRGEDILLAKLDLAGVVAWTYTVDGGGGRSDEGRACALASNGDLLIAGSKTRAAGTYSDLWAARMTSGRTFLWDYLVDGPAGTVDSGLGLAVDAQGVRVVGFLSDPGSPSPPRYYVADLVESSTTLTTSDGPTVPRASPNPFRPGRGGPFDASSITFRSLPAGSAVRVYTLAGELVADLKDDNSDGLVVWDAKNSSGKDAVAGVYLFVVDPGQGAVTRGKVVIIR